MIRNAVWLLSTIGVLAALFVGYNKYLRIEPQEVDRLEHPLDKVKPVQVSDDESLTFPSDQGDVSISPGEAMTFTIFDPATGRASLRVQCDSWSKVKDTRSDLDVVAPRFQLFRPDGQAATISADHGEFVVEYVEGNRWQPKRGTLDGNVRVTLDRPADEPGDDDDAAAAANLLTVEMQQVEFDVELRELRTADRIHVINPQAEIAGTGLHMVWNQADNRLETLEIARGERLSIALESDVFASLTGAGEQAEQKTDEGAAPVERQPRDVTTYSAILTGAVAAKHYKGEEVVGALDCDELRLRIDIDSAAAGRLGPSGADKSQAADVAPDVGADVAVSPSDSAASHPVAEATTQPIEPPLPQRLEVVWSGPLRIEPLKTEYTARKPQREIEALGRDVDVHMGGSVIHCGRIELQEQTKRVWLHPASDGRVTITQPNRFDATARTIYIDGRAGLVKLIDDVRLAARSGGQASRDSLTIRSRHWAELHLARRETDQSDGSDSTIDGAPDDGPIPVGRLESAVFVGGVHVDIDGRTLDTDRLETTFASAPRLTTVSQPTGDGTATNEVIGDDEDGGNLRLESAVAFGNVTLRADEQGLRTFWLRIDFAPGPDGRPYPDNIEALRQVRLEDASQDFIAAGRRLTARLTPDGHLLAARVYGAPSAPAWLYARGYTIRGNQLDVARRDDADSASAAERAYRLEAPGGSELRFLSTRSLRGQRRRGAMPVVLTANQLLSVDADRVRFLGGVTATSGDERLRANEMTLLLRDAPRDSSSADDALPGPVGLIRAIAPLPTAAVTAALRIAKPLRSSYQRVQERARFARAITPTIAVEPHGQLALARRWGRTIAVAQQQAPRESAGLLGVSESRERSVRKEPLRLEARQAWIVSETYDPVRRRNIISQEITAPELLVEFEARTIRTVGETILGMTSLQLPGTDRAKSDDVGLPSALITAGPTQSALKCSRAMTYALGEEDPERVDSVIFEGDVIFRYVAGKQVRKLEELMPELAGDPQLKAALKDRNTRLEADRLALTLAARSASDANVDNPSTLRLAWLSANGDVYVRDQIGAGVREIEANQIEFDRNASTVRVLGDTAQNKPARIFYENAVTGRFDEPASGPAFIIFLDTNTVKAEGGVSGSVGR